MRRLRASGPSRTPATTSSRPIIVCYHRRSMSPQSKAPVWLMPLLLGLLMLSGSCALIYQVLWLRLLALTFGVTVHAAATVLGCFMGGLAVGSMLAGRWADRHARPLFLFGLVELAIGLCGFLSPLQLVAVQRWF